MSNVGVTDCVCVCASACMHMRAQKLYLIHEHPVTVFGGQVCFHRLQKHREKEQLNNKPRMI